MSAGTGARQLRLDEATLFLVKNTRTQDHATSIAAARSVRTRADSHRHRALRTHYEHAEGLDDFALAEITGIQQTSCGKRRLELLRMGFIEKTNETRLSPSGSAVIVWRITDAGKAEYERYVAEAENAWIAEGH